MLLRLEKHIEMQPKQKKYIQRRENIFKKCVKMH